MSMSSDTSDSKQADISSIKLNIEKAQRTLNELYENQGNLNIYAPISGVIFGLEVKAGDNINAGNALASIKDTDNSYIEVYFLKDDFDKISVGDKVSIFMTGYFATETGSVAEKDSTPVQMGGGISGYLITLKMSNPGGYSTGDIAQVTVDNSHGTFQGMSNGKIVEVKEEKVNSKISGKIKNLNAENGKYVNTGDLLATIEGDDLSFEIEEAQNSIAKYQSQIDELAEGDTVYSPMDGTVLQINVSEEEVVDRATALMTVADLNNMEVVIAVDELDINKIKLGHKAAVTSDTYPDEEFSGSVFKISMEGTSSNGVTTYEVTVKLDDRKSLMSGMNVDVEILADSRENVLTVPIDAVHKLNGSYIVTVKDSSGNKKDVKVELGLATKDNVEITSGLNEGDVVIYSAVKSESSKMPSGGMNVMRTPGMEGAPTVRMEGGWR
ncbi:MAG TPA: hypothetical protein DCM73_00780 [Clostridiales bacterium]|nr:hypothetical protein [Clostridiales bacterium]